MVLTGDNAYPHIVGRLSGQPEGYGETYLIDATDGVIDAICFKLDNFGFTTDIPFRNVYGQVQLTVRR